MFQFHNMGKGSEMHCSGVSNHLGCLVETIVWTSPIQDSHPEQAQENRIIDSSPVHLSKPFSSPDHVGPKLIIKEEVRVDIPPPSVVGGRFILPGFLDAMEHILGDLQFSVSISTSRNKEGNYLKRWRVVTVTRQQGMFPIVPLTDVPQEQTGSQLDDWMTTILTKDQRPDDWMLDVGSHG